MTTGRFQKQLLKAAVSVGLLGKDLHTQVLEEASRNGQGLLDLASSRLRLPREAFYRALAQERGLPYLEPSSLVPDTQLVKRIPPAFVRRKVVLPVARKGEVLVALGDPDDDTVLETLQRILNRPFRIAIAEPTAIEGAVRKLGLGILTESPGTWDAVAFFDDLMQQAHRRRASDIHLVPHEDGLHARMRVDGRLQHYGVPLGQEEAGQLLSRIKVLGGLDIAEKREPQDGALVYELAEDTTIDVRLATAPIRHGERATLRLLGIETQELTLENLGLADEELDRFREVLRSPHGLVLITGPTGSGKTTTLYAALRAVLDPTLNVMTVEDPVEFLIPGVSQLQVDQAGKVTFASALRSLLRHDPDVLMVGEIRDQETADIAVRAAMTGHLVLSSVHSNRATSAVLRLVDLGCERSLVASTLRGVVAQRLARRLCQSCRVPRLASADALAPLGGEEGATVYEAMGCPACLGTGFFGRVALAEGLWVSSGVREEIESGSTEEALARRARENGFRSLGRDGLDKVLAGVTSVDEALLARI